MKHKTKAMRLQTSRANDWAQHHIASSEAPPRCPTCKQELYLEWDYIKKDSTWICVNPDCKTARVAK